MMCFHTLVNSFPIQPSNTFPFHRSPIHLTSFKMFNFFSFLHFSTCSNLHVPIVLGPCYQLFPMSQIPWQVVFPFLPSYNSFHTFFTSCCVFFSFSLKISPYTTNPNSFPFSYTCFLSLHIVFSFLFFC